VAGLVGKMPLTQPILPGFVNSTYVWFNLFFHIMPAVFFARVEFNDEDNDEQKSKVALVS